MLSKHEEQEERLEILRNDQRLRNQGSTFSQFAQSEAAEDRGRYSSISNPTVVGSNSLPNYPAGPAWSAADQGLEAPDWLKALVSAPKPIHTQDRDDGGISSGPQVTEPDLQSQSRDTDRQVPRNIYFLILRGMPRAKAQTQRRVRGLWKNLAEKSQGRNDGLNYTAWQFSQFIGAGDLNREIASRLLWLACEANGYLAKDGADVVKEVINRVLQPETEE